MAACRSEVAALGARLDEIASQVTGSHERVMQALRFVRDDDARARATLWELRETPEYARAFEEDEPLVTILVTTYRNWPMLRERCLPSIVDQSYERIEVIVVGDAAPPETEEVVRSFADDRLRFVNLPYNGPYPSEPRDAWLVSGSTPWNTGLALAQGRWIGSNSDDDALRPNYVESLLKLARDQRAEVPYGQILMRKREGDDEVLGVVPTRARAVGHSVRAAPRRPALHAPAPHRLGLRGAQRLVAARAHAAHRRALRGARGARGRLLPLPAVDRETVDVDLKPWRLVDLPVVHDARGNLTFIEGGRHVPSTSRASTTSTTCPAAPSAAATPTGRCTS